MFKESLITCDKFVIGCEIHAGMGIRKQGLVPWKVGTSLSL